MPLVLARTVDRPALPVSSRSVVLEPTFFHHPPMQRQQLQLQQQRNVAPGPLGHGRDACFKREEDDHVGLRGRVSDERASGCEQGLSLSPRCDSRGQHCLRVRLATGTTPRRPGAGGQNRVRTSVPNTARAMPTVTASAARVHVPAGAPAAPPPTPEHTHRTHRTTVGHRPANMTRQPSFWMLWTATFHMLGALTPLPEYAASCILVLMTSKGKVAWGVSGGRGVLNQPTYHPRCDSRSTAGSHQLGPAQPAMQLCFSLVDQRVVLVGKGVPLAVRRLAPLEETAQSLVPAGIVSWWHKLWCATVNFRCVVQRATITRRAHMTVGWPCGGTLPLHSAATPFGVGPAVCNHPLRHPHSREEVRAVCQVSADRRRHAAVQAPDTALAHNVLGHLPCRGVLRWRERLLLDLARQRATAWRRLTLTSSMGHVRRLGVLVAEVGAVVGVSDALLLPSSSLPSRPHYPHRLTKPQHHSRHPPT